MQVTVRTRGVRELQTALRGIDLQRNPGVRRRALRRSSVLLRAGIRDNLRGPAPRRLERRTGRTIRSLTIDRAGLPESIEVGFPSRLWWMEFYEMGGRGRRFRRKRPSIVPGINAALPGIERAFLREWERGLDGPR